MGSVRRGLALATVLAPTTALAEVCDTHRPDWTGETVSPWAEAVTLFSTLPALVLIAATLLAWRFRSQWGGLAAVLFWSFLLTATVSYDPTGLREAATAEGCLGDPIAFIGAVIVICVATILYTAPRQPGRPTKKDTP